MDNKLNEILKNSAIPQSTKDMVNSLDSGGKYALNSMFDENSDFFIHANTEKIAHQFYAAPESSPFLYHYTDQSGLTGIISSKTVRIGSQYYMNDTEENIYVLNMAREYLIQNNALEDEIKFFEQNYSQKQFDAYIWSFTKNPNSQALLTYGDFALKFKNQEIQEAMVETLNPNISSFEEMQNGNSYVFPLRVEYDQKIQKEYISSVMSIYLKACKNIHIDPYDMFAIIRNCHQALSLFALCFKNPILYQEEEIRFVAVRKSTDNNLHPDKIINGKPTIIFPFPPSLIKRIIFSRNVQNLKNIENLLILNEFPPTLLERTKLPYGRKK